MSAHESAEASQATARALQALRGAVATVAAIGDPQQALERAGDLIDSLRAVAQELDELRVRKAAAIAKAEELSLAHLADRPAHQRRPPARQE